MMKKLLAVALIFVPPYTAIAQPFPYPLQAGQPASANQVMSDIAAAQANATAVAQQAQAAGIAAAAQAQATAIAASANALTTGALNGGVVTSTGSSVARTLASRAADVVNVLDWGAKCDGSTDDTAAIQAAMNSAANRATVFVPNSLSACVVAGLNVPSKTRMEIDGTLLLHPQASTGIVHILTGVTNVTIFGSGTLNGNAPNESIVGQAGIDTAGNNSNINISGLKITNTLNWPINITGSLGPTHGVRLSHLTLSNGGSSVEFAAGVSDCWADDLDISNIGDEGFAFYGAVSNCGISNSYITGSLASGVSLLNDVAQSSPAHDIVISNNVIYANKLSGVEIAEGTGSDAGSGLDYNVVVSGNRIYGNNTYATAAGFSDVEVQAGYNVSITGNLMGPSANSGNGVFLGPGITGASIIGNTIFDEGQGTTNGVGINDGGATNTTIASNLIYDDQTTKSMAFAINGTAGAGTVLTNNNMRGTIGPPDNLAKLSDTIVAEAPSPGAPYTISNLAVTGSAVLPTINGNTIVTGVLTGEGNINTNGNFYALQGYLANNGSSAVAGLSCAGPPTSGFATIGGIVTHC